MGFGVLLAWIDVVTGCSDQWLLVFDTLVICFRLSQFYLRLIPRSVVLHIFYENNQRLQLSFSWKEETQTIQSREVKTSDCRARADRTEANALRRSFSRAASKEFSIRLHLHPHRHPPALGCLAAQRPFRRLLRAMPNPHLRHADARTLCTSFVLLYLLL